MLFKSRIILLLLSLFFLSQHVGASRVDTLQVQSPSMKRSLEVLVVVPDACIAQHRVSVLYLLHGHGGHARSWLNLKPELRDMADRDSVLIVCPTGEASWYLDSPLKSDSRFETFVSSELVAYVDSHYATFTDRKHRAITGLSMGGHGALWLSIRHQDVFGAAGATSGGVDFTPFPTNWGLPVILGEQASHLALWQSHTVMSQLDKLQNEALALIFDCGTDDFFYEVNCKLHEALLQRGIFHDFIARPGRHNGTYWKNSLDYQWMFFTKFFRGYRSALE